MTMTLPYRLAAIDIDDTLVGPDKGIGSANRDAVRQLQDAGVTVILASGRRHANMISYCRELGLMGYIISCQGARAEHLATGEVIHRALLTPEQANQLTLDGLDRGLTVFRWQTDGIYTQTHDQWVDVYRHESGSDQVNVADLRSLSDQPAEKIVWAAEPATLLRMLDEQKANAARADLSMLITNDWYLEFSAADAHKAAGVAAVAERLGVDREQVIAFGDGNNDVTMLQWAGMGVAMPHGRANAKAAARVVAPQGDPETALARAVQMLLDVG